MGKELAKKAGTAAIESMLRSFLPEMKQEFAALHARMEKIEDRIQKLERHVDFRFSEFQQQMFDKFEQTRDVINELGQRIARQEGGLELLLRSIDRNTSSLEQYIERVVRLETLQTVRKRRAG